MEPVNKKLVIFDLDSTLAESKQPIDTEMTALLSKLLETHLVAIISGASFAQFQTQALPSLSLPPEKYERLFLMPTSGAALYTWNGKEWEVQYEKRLPASEIEKITSALSRAVQESGYQADETFGETIENRDTQITYSALGQRAPLEAKRRWDPDQKKRQYIVSLLAPLLPDFTVHIGGATSIDITARGIDKAYGINALSLYLEIPIEEMLFVGDALYPGGNDSAVTTLGIETIAVNGTEETKKVISQLLS